MRSDTDVPLNGPRDDSGDTAGDTAADTAGGARGLARFVVPEFTRSLRGFASVQALGSRDHELVFGPLMTARRSAARVLAPDARAAAFDADRLTRSLADAIGAISRDRAGADEALQRALEARLEERAAPVFAALSVVAVRAATLRGAAPAAQGDAWEPWCDAVQALFNAVDLFWFAIADVAPSRGAVGRGASGGATLARGLVLAVAAAGAVAASSTVTHGQAGAPRVTLRVNGARPDSLLGAGFDVVGVEPGTVLVVANPRDRARLELGGLRTAEVPVSRAQILANAVAVTTVYRSFDDPVRGIRRWADSIVAANPRVSVDTIGLSHEGRPMLMLKVGAKGDSPQRPNALFMSTYHAREWAATETALRLVAWLAAPPGTDARRDSLVQSRDIYVMPVANPDGYQYSFSNDRLWRKTRSPQAGGAVGADMNRNHSARWGLDNQGSSSEPLSEIFRGPAPASEIEVRNIEAFHVAHPPIVAISYHTFSGLLLYPPGAVYGELSADLPAYRALAGTNLKSAVTDRVPGSNRTSYAPGPGWMLYTTNGEYTDFAATRHGAIAFTTELTSGYTGNSFYGFEFPDNEVLLERVFQDNLPFALDLLDAARAPAAVVSQSTGRSAPRLTVESVSPDIRVIVPAAAASAAKVSIGAALSYRVDSAGGGRFTRRLVSAAVSRPAAFSVTSGISVANFRVLLAGGAEPTDAGWTAQGFAADSIFARAGRFSWFGTNGTLRSPVVTVPTESDTVSLVYWTTHSGSGFTAEPSGVVEASTDGGTTWSTVLIQRGFAPLWYTDQATLGGVRGKSVAFRFTASALPWRLDEVAVVAHGAVTSGATVAANVIRPSENPVRSGTVGFSWPFGATGGEIAAFDFSGRRLWRSVVTNGVVPLWDVRAQGIGNGVYVVVATSGSRTSRLKLFIARTAP